MAAGINSVPQLIDAHAGLLFLDAKGQQSLTQLGPIKADKGGNGSDLQHHFDFFYPRGIFFEAVHATFLPYFSTDLIRFFLFVLNHRDTI